MSCICCKKKARTKYKSDPESEPSLNTDSLNESVDEPANEPTIVKSPRYKGTPPKALENGTLKYRLAKKLTQISPQEVYITPIESKINNNVKKLAYINSSRSEEIKIIKKIVE